MNQPETTGTLASGRTFRVTGYLLDVNEADGALTARVDATDLRGVRREGTLVTVERSKGGPLRLNGASIDDAGRLELALRAMLPQPQKQQGGGALRAFKAVTIGCGGLTVLIVAAFFVVVAANGSIKNKPKYNIVLYQAGATAQTSELSLTLQTINDPWTSDNQFDQPQSGNKFIRYHVIAKDVDKRDHTVNEFSFKLTTSDSHAYDPTITVDGFKAFNLSAGQITEGDVVFEVPATATVKELKYDNGIGSDDLFWRP